MPRPHRFLVPSSGLARNDRPAVRSTLTRAGSHASIASLLVLSLVHSTACGPNAPTDASSHRFTVTVEDGVEVALTTGGPRHEGDIFEYEKVLTMRPDPGVPESYIGYAGVMTMAEDGTILVADQQADRIVAFAPDGSFVRTFGRRGQGPGEFQIVALLEVVDGVLWAEDVVAQRSHAFALDGTLLRTVTIPAQARGERGLIDGEWWILSDNRIVVSKLGSGREEQRNTVRAEMLVIDGDGNALARAETPWLSVTESVQPADLSEAGSVDLQFRGLPAGQYSRDHGFFLMRPDQPEVRVYDLEGDLIRILRVDLPPRPVTRDDRFRVEQRLEEELQRALNPDETASYRPDPERARFARDNPRYVDPKDYWQGMFIDDQGFVWLMPLPDDGGFQSDPSRTAWLVLSPEGEFLGRTTAPGRHFHRGHVLTTEEDPESGERLPVLYRMRPTVRQIDYR